MGPQHSLARANLLTRLYVAATLSTLARLRGASPTPAALSSAPPGLSRSVQEHPAAPALGHYPAAPDASRASGVGSSSRYLPSAPHASAADPQDPGLGPPGVPSEHAEVGQLDPGAATDLDAQSPRHTRQPALGADPRRLPSREGPNRACGRDGQTHGERTRRETCSSPSPVRQLLASPCGERGGRKRGKGSRRGGEEEVGEAGVQLVKQLRLPLIFSLLAPLLRADTSDLPWAPAPRLQRVQKQAGFFFFLSFWKLALVCVSLRLSSSHHHPPPFFFF